MSYFGTVFALRAHDKESGLVYAQRTTGYQATVWARRTDGGPDFPSAGKDFPTYQEAIAWLQNQNCEVLL